MWGSTACGGTPQTPVSMRLNTTCNPFSLCCACCHELRWVMTVPHIQPHWLDGWNILFTDPPPGDPLLLYQYQADVPSWHCHASMHQHRDSSTQRMYVCSMAADWKVGQHSCANTLALAGVACAIALAHQRMAKASQGLSLA